MPAHIYGAHTVGKLLQEWYDKFVDVNIPDPRESVDKIFAHVLNFEDISKIYDFDNNELSRAEEHTINHLCNKRLERVPMPYILRKLKFRDLDLKMTPPVFIPWPETENFIDVALEAIDAKKAEVVLELCCGSGAICLAILKARPQLKMIAVDKSDEACKLTAENATTLNLLDRIKIIQSKITIKGEVEGINQKFDVIVSNPPYVPYGNIEALGPEFTEYQDLAAVESGDDGLHMIKLVLNVGSKMLNNNGRFVMEVNPTHPELIKSWLEDNCELGLTFVRALKDYNNLYRYVEVVKN